MLVLLLLPEAAGKTGVAGAELTVKESVALQPEPVVYVAEPVPAVVLAAKVKELLPVNVVPVALVLNPLKEPDGLTVPEVLLLVQMEGDDGLIVGPEFTVNDLSA